MAHGIPNQRFYLFTDLRHVLCSDLEWRGADGQKLPLYPQGPSQPVRTTPGQMPRGLRFFVERGTKTDPVPRFARWQKDPIPPNALWRRRITCEGGTYRAWSVRKPGVHSSNAFEICCETSSDGFDWQLARASVVELPATGDAETFAVFRDPRAPSSERYKAVICAEPPKEQWPQLFEEYKRVNAHHRIWRLGEKFVFAVYGLVSPDGLDWRPLPGHLMVNFLDSDTSIHFDKPLGKYVMYTRLMFQQRRWIGRAVSDDFRNWSAVDPIIAPPIDGSMTDDMYQNGFTFYPGESAYYLMFPMIYHRANQRSSIHLYSSEDGIAWVKVPGGAVIEPGTPGSFDSEFLAVGRDLVPMGADRIALPYMGTRFPHKHPRWPEVMEAPRYAWAWWPRGRLCGLRAESEGNFVTFPLEVAGKELRVNARVNSDGEVRVGILDQPGRSVADCETITGDGANLAVRWRESSSVGLPAGQHVTLEFRLRSADLFAFNWI